MAPTTRPQRPPLNSEKPGRKQHDRQRDVHPSPGGEVKDGQLVLVDQEEGVLGEGYHPYERLENGAYHQQDAGKVNPTYPPR